MVILIVACPCSLVLAAPVPCVGAIGAAAKHQTLIKSSETLEALAAVDAVFTDKTSTLTQGRCRVVGQVAFGDGDAAAALGAAAALEARSAHPLATAIVNAATGCLGDVSDDDVPFALRATVADFRTVDGRGPRGNRPF